MRGAATAVAILAALTLTACGSSSSDSDSAGGEAAEIVEQLKSLEKGEIVIQGMSTPRTYGPYVFERGGYVLHFDQPNADDDEPLRVELRSKRDSTEPPYQLLVDAPRRSGTEDVALQGKLFVHVESASGDYVLRFKPKPR